MAKRPPHRPRGRARFNPNGFYSYREVCELTTLSRQTIYLLRIAGRFPEPTPLTSGRIGWLKPVIHRWIADRAARDLAPDDQDGVDGEDGEDE
ncbi:helix-turn-helix transcriptional regulator [Rhizobium ruizarguesonis]|uniref:helix-turn-helix transcriptional regulator n=1 Tax=Rhizobium ruizarguesonis TaxID=2081791 RepID=UPI0013EE97C6